MMITLRHGHKQGNASRIESHIGIIEKKLIPMKANLACSSRSKGIMRSFALARCLATVASGEKLKVLSVLYRAGSAASNQKLLGMFCKAESRKYMLLRQFPSNLHGHASDTLLCFRLISMAEYSMSRHFQCKVFSF